MSKPDKHLAHAVTEAYQAYKDALARRKAADTPVALCNARREVEQARTYYRRLQEALPGCIRCGREAEHLIGGHCKVCISTQCTRARLDKLSAEGTPCARCGLAGVRFAYGEICWPCYQYRRKHGTDRPIKTACGDCSTAISPQAGILTGLCMSCQSYRRRHGKPKPENYTRPTAAGPCQNEACGRTVKNRRAGRCQSCYLFHKRNGRDIARHEMKPNRKEAV